MILANENIHSGFILTLREAGFHVVSVSENFKSIKDEQFIRLALENDYLLLTENKDFGEWVFAHHVKNLSVLFLRYTFYEFQEIGTTLIYLLKNHELKHLFFSTITTRKI